MTAFQKKHIGDTRALGAQLKEARTERRWSIEDVSAHLGIAPHYLVAIESGVWERLPGGIYSRRFLSAYSAWAGCDSEEILELFETTHGGEHTLTQEALSTFHEVPRFHIPWWRVVKMSISLGVFFLFLWYFSIRFFDAFTPPSLAVELPEEPLVTTASILELRGHTEPEASVTVNTSPIALRPDGSFFTTLSLLEGSNLLHIVAKKQYGRPHVIERTIFVFPEQKVSVIE